MTGCVTRFTRISFLLPRSSTVAAGAVKDDAGETTGENRGIDADTAFSIAAQRVRTFGEQPLATSGDKAGT